MNSFIFKLVYVNVMLVEGKGRWCWSGMVHRIHRHYCQERMLSDILLQINLALFSQQVCIILSKHPGFTSVDSDPVQQ